MSNLRVIPFTEIYERVQAQMRDSATGSSNEAKYKAIANDVYLRLLPSEYKWPFLRKTATVQTNGDYNTGTITASGGTTTLTGTDTVWASSMYGRQIKITGNEDLYTFSYTSPTDGSLSFNMTGTSTVSTGSYVIFDYDYPAPSDFIDGELTKIYYWQGNQKQYLRRDDETKWETRQSLSVGTPDNFRIFGTDSSGYDVIEVTPPPDTDLLLYLEYEEALSALSEYTTGYCTTSNGDATVTGSSTLFTTNISVGDYFRMDANGTGADSKWYKIASTASNTSLELEDSWGEASITTPGNYTISKAPAIPYYLHDAIVSGTCFVIATEQGDRNGISIYAQLYQNAVNKAKRRNERKNLNKRMKTYLERPGARR